MTAWLDPLRLVLEEASEPITFFFRDDDAGWRDRRLLELLDIFAAHSLPIDLAVIPKELQPSMAGQLRARRATAPGELGLHQHGFLHANHEGNGRKWEFGPTRSEAAQRRDISEGRRILQDLLGGDIHPIFTPPWNRCTMVTGRCLRQLGFRALSRHSRHSPLAIAGLYELPIRVDWFAHRDGVRFTRQELGEELARAAVESDVVGIMFHHAVMDSHERADAAELLQVLASHRTARCRLMPDIIDQAICIEHRSEYV